MRNRIYALLLVICLLCSLTGCSGSKIKAMDADEVLLSIDGQPAMTVRDFRCLLSEHALSAEYLGTEEISEKELFLRQAELTILSYVTEEYGLGYDTDELEKEYTDHVAEIQDTDIYGTEYAYFLKLQETLGMDDAAYKAWNMEQSLRDYNADALLGSLAETYLHITDPEILREYMQLNLLELVKVYEIRLAYPGLDLHDLTFETYL